MKIPLQEAYKALEAKIWNSCVVMCGRSVEEAAKDLGATGGNLMAKIDNLEQSQKITPALKEWAHEARLAGNLGAHGSSQQQWPSEQDAREIIEFTKWFMRYTYVLPKQIAERRAQISGDAQTTSPSEKDSNE